MSALSRPPRTDAHRLRDTYLQQFADLGLTPILSTNGSIPEADIQVVKGAQPGDVPECWITARGQARLAAVDGSADLSSQGRGETAGPPEPHGDGA